jgi:hypothetical protein
MIAGMEPAGLLVEEIFGLSGIKSECFPNFPPIEYFVDFLLIPAFAAWLYFLQRQSKSGVFYARPFINFEIAACFYFFVSCHICDSE